MIPPDRNLFLWGNADGYWEGIVDLFSNLAATFWLWNKEQEAHATEKKEITQAVNNNSRILQKLLFMGEC